MDQMGTIRRKEMLTSVPAELFNQTIGIDPTLVVERIESTFGTVVNYSDPNLGDRVVGRVSTNMDGLVSYFIDG